VTRVKTVSMGDQVQNYHHTDNVLLWGLSIHAQYSWPAAAVVDSIGP
jgi:hypothetical protein